jgi:hypothetical protein
LRSKRLGYGAADDAGADHGSSVISVASHLLVRLVRI